MSEHEFKAKVEMCGINYNYLVRNEVAPAEPMLTENVQNHEPQTG